MIKILKSIFVLLLIAAFLISARKVLTNYNPIFGVSDAKEATVVDGDDKDEHPGIKAPEFTTTDAKYWINSKPLKWEDLKGKVVFLDVWTYT